MHAIIAHADVIGELKHPSRFALRSSADKTDLVGSDFYAFHVSGGTTEVLKVTGSDDKFISSSVIGGTLDLNAGQVIDRIGVLMGLSFPAGRAMEALALEYCGKIDPFTPSVKGIECNLSGLENKASQLFENTHFFLCKTPSKSARMSV